MYRRAAGVVEAKEEEDDGLCCGVCLSCLERKEASQKLAFCLFVLNSIFQLLLLGLLLCFLNRWCCF